jgi:hypothetical protein
VNGTCVVEQGVPFYLGLLVDSTNTAEATWSAYTSSNFTVSLPDADGPHQVRVLLRGHAPGDVPIFDDTEITLDRVAPLLVITSPQANTTNARPLIQVGGYALESLAEVRFDVSNAVGVVANQDGGVTRQWFDPHLFRCTTNWIACEDLELTNGVNGITVRVMDRAGNITATNFTVTVDYAVATNPVVAVLWPSNNVQLAGETFTVRGTLDDPTAVVIAQLTSTNGVITTDGVVERNGTFWVENLPLAGGTNWLLLTVTNVAGQATETNLTFIRSGISLGMDALAPEGLCRAKVDATGTISDTAAAVFVNGVAAVNHGDGTWSAVGVPVSPGGVASFDVQAQSGGQTTQAGTNAAKPAHIVVTSYDLVWSYPVPWGISNASTLLTNFTGGNFNTQTNTGATNSGLAWGELHWINDCGTTAFATVSNLYGICTQTTDWPADEYLLSVGTPQQEGNQTHNCPPSVVTVGPPPVGLEHCEVAYEGTTRKAQTILTLHTGGKGLSRQKNLFRVSGSATAITNLTTMESRPVPSERITMGALGQLGTDGNRWCALPDNATRDVTPTVSGEPYYSFGASATKHELVIKANGIVLDSVRILSNAVFCVGQKIDLEAIFVPPASSLTSTNPRWNIPGQFVNYHYTGDANCELYLRGTYWLSQNPTRAWYYDGDDGKEMRFGVAFNCHFQNGQKANPLGRGKFKVHRPIVVGFTNMPPHFAWVNTNGWRTWLQLGTDSGEAPGSMGFYGRVRSDFQGKANWTQLIRSHRIRDETYPLGSWTWSTDGEYWLDGARWGAPNEFYLDEGDALTVSPPISSSPLYFGDSPGWPVGLTVVSIDDQFQTYFRFRPDGPESIWVTLGRVDWSWSAVAELGANNFAITSEYVPAPQWREDNAFPVWDNYVITFDF